jgi:hypothetical protein
VRERIERRSDPRRRAVACRDALLDWRYGRNRADWRYGRNPADIQLFPNDVRAHFEGDCFTKEEIVSATCDLIEKGFLGGGRVSLIPRSAVVLEITAAGKTVVESYGSSISAYENRNQNGSPMINITGSTFSGQLSIGDHNRQTQTNNGVAGSELAELMQAVLDAAKGTDVENRVNKLITQLDLEVDEEQPDPSTVEKTLDRLKAVGTTTVAVLPAIDRLIEFVHDKLQAIKIG